MLKAIAFFPWVYTDEIIEIGRIRLIPYVRKNLPKDLPNVIQKNIDGVLKAYATRKNVLIKQATLIEVDDWKLGLDAEDYIQSLFRARELIAFSALSQRKLFGGHFNYTNYDSYTMVVQRFDPISADTFSFHTRRRDGGTRHLWSSDEFAFIRPNYVDSDQRIALDRPILEALIKLDDSHERFYEALIEFNSANTDSPTVPQHVELVMIKSAFEGLLDVNHKAANFAKVLLELLADVLPAHEDKSKKSIWMKHYPKAKRPIEAWAREFSAVRGSAAHGKQRQGSHFVWGPHSHMAFASHFFPLLVKKKLADMQLMKLDSYDQERLALSELYIAADPFDFDRNSSKNKSHPWVEIQNNALFSSRRNAVYKIVKETLNLEEQ
jgi:hypothetical protein